MKLREVTHPAVAQALLNRTWTRAELDIRGLRVFDAGSGTGLTVPLPNPSAALQYTAQVLQRPLELLRDEPGGPDVRASALRDRHGALRAVTITAERLTS